MKAPRLVFEDSGAGASLFGARRSLPGVAGAALALLAVAALAHAGWRLAHAQAQVATLQARATALQGTAAPATAPAARHDPLRVRAWNAVAHQLNTPWSELLATLETATPADVALVSVVPDTAQGAVRLQAEAKSLPALLAYERALRAAPLFRDVLLARHETHETDSQRPVRLHLVLRMRPPQEAPR
jgi:hypothetical protein